MKQLTIREVKQKAELAAIRSALLNSRGNVTQAAVLLDVDRSYLHRRMKKYKIKNKRT